MFGLCRVVCLLQTEERDPSGACDDIYYVFVLQYVKKRVEVSH